jgi:hypothetical protein
MAQYLMYATVTYSNVGNKNSALTALEAVVAQYSDILTPTNAGPYASGVLSSPSNTVVEYAYLIDEVNLDEVRTAFRDARQAGTRSGAVISTVKIT